MVPNAVEAQHFEDLKLYYTDRQIAEIVAVISLFGFLNRWNDTMAMPLEDQATAFATRLLNPMVGRARNTLAKVVFTLHRFQKQLDLLGCNREQRIKQLLHGTNQLNRCF